MDLASSENPEIQMQTIPHRPINPLASLTVVGIGWLRILETFEVSKSLMSGKMDSSIIAKTTLLWSIIVHNSYYSKKGC